MAKLGKNENVTIDVLVKICTALQCDIGDIMEITENFEKWAIEVRCVEVSWTVDTKKLDKWADLLLDTGKRNNLINFKDTKASTAEVLLPTADALFEKIDGSASFEVFDPKIIEKDEEPEEFSEIEQLQIEPPEESDTSSRKAAFLARYSGKIKRQSQILLYNSATNPLTAVKNIDKKAREFIEETGVNVAYMAFGFIHWKESDSSGYVFRAPILLVPIQLV